MHLKIGICAITHMPNYVNHLKYKVSAYLQLFHFFEGK
jgi:hypothetical protein